MNKRALFPLFQTPIDLSHSYWKSILKAGDVVIDATCGNGYDTLFLAEILLSENLSGEIIALDFQTEAIQKTKDRLSYSLSSDQFLKVKFYTQCHSSFPKDLKVQSVKLIVYNLGYLPTGNKNLTTNTDTTLQSISSALPLITSGGCVSITCYPGHVEGEKEERSILSFCADLKPADWSCCHHRWINRTKAPSLILLQKNL